MTTQVPFTDAVETPQEEGPALSLPELRKLWDSLSPAEQDAYYDDYAWAVIDSGRDASDLLFYPLLKG